MSSCVSIKRPGLRLSSVQQKLVADLQRHVPLGTKVMHIARGDDSKYVVTAQVGYVADWVFDGFDFIIPETQTDSKSPADAHDAEPESKSDFAAAAISPVKANGEPKLQVLWTKVLPRTLSTHSLWSDLGSGRICIPR